MPVAISLKEMVLPKESDFYPFLKKNKDIEALQYQDGEFLVTQGEESEDIFLVLTGAFVVEQARDDPSKRPTELAITITGDDAPIFVGEMSYLGDGIRTATVRVSGATCVLKLKPKHLDKIIHKFPKLTRILFTQFTDRLKKTNSLLKQVQELLALDAELVVKTDGERITNKGDPATVLYQLVEGALRKDGGNVVTADMLPSGFVDPAPYFLDGVYSTGLKVEGMAILLANSTQAKLPVIRSHPGIVLDILQGRGV